jgi:hypothetical protein
MLKDAFGGAGMPSPPKVPAATVPPPPEGMDRSFLRKIDQVLKKKQKFGCSHSHGNPSTTDC